MILSQVYRRATRARETLAVDLPDRGSPLTAKPLWSSGAPLSVLPRKPRVADLVDPRSVHVATVRFSALAWRESRLVLRARMVATCLHVPYHFGSLASLPFIRLYRSYSNIINFTRCVSCIAISTNLRSYT